MSSKQKKMLIRIIIAGVIYAALLIWSTTTSMFNGSKYGYYL